MYVAFEKPQRWETFEECVADLKRRYRRTHPTETEGLHYEFVVGRQGDGKSGFVKVERLESSSAAPSAQTETLQIEDNRVVGINTADQPPVGREPIVWFEA